MLNKKLELELEISTYKNKDHHLGKCVKRNADQPVHSGAISEQFS